MPMRGTAKKINPIRINNPKIPQKNVTEVLPSPFNTLFKVVFKYKNGQSHASTVMKFPARSFEKNNVPRCLPKSKKNSRQKTPRRMQKRKAFWMVCFST